MGSLCEGVVRVSGDCGRTIRVESLFICGQIIIPVNLERVVGEIFDVIVRAGGCWTHRRAELDFITIHQTMGCLSNGGTVNWVAIDGCTSDGLHRNIIPHGNACNSTRGTRACQVDGVGGSHGIRLGGMQSDVVGVVGVDVIRRCGVRTAGCIGVECDRVAIGQAMVSFVKLIGGVISLESCSHRGTGDKVVFGDLGDCGVSRADILTHI